MRDIVPDTGQEDQGVSERNMQLEMTKMSMAESYVREGGSDVEEFIQDCALSGIHLTGYTAELLLQQASVAIAGENND